MFVSVVSLQYPNQSKQFAREHISLFFTENLGVFQFFSFFFSFFNFFRFVSKQFVSVVSLIYQNREFRCFDWTATNRRPTQTVEERVYLGFFRTFRVVSVCFGLLRISSVCFGCFNIGLDHRNKPKFFVFGFTKQTKTNAKQILFRFVSVWTKIYFCLFLEHPRPALEHRPPSSQSQPPQNSPCCTAAGRTGLACLQQHLELEVLKASIQSIVNHVANLSRFRVVLAVLQEPDQCLLTAASWAWGIEGLHPEHRQPCSQSQPPQNSPCCTAAGRTGLACLQQHLELEVLKASIQSIVH